MLRPLALIVMLGTITLAGEATVPPDVQRSLEAYLDDMRGARKDAILLVSPINGIARLGPAAVLAALPTLEPLLLHPDPAVRVAVLNAIAPPVELPRESVLRIEPLTASTDESVRVAAKDLLDRIAIYREHKARAVRLADLGQADAATMLASLDGDDLRSREAAIAAARARCLVDPAFSAALAGELPVMLRLVKHPDPRVREVALLVLARGFEQLPSSATDAVVAATEDQHESVKLAALAALARGQASDLNATAALVREAANPAPRIRGAAYAALARIGSTETDLITAAIGDLSQPKASDAWVGACALVQAGRERRPEAVPVLERLIADPTLVRDTHLAALKALSTVANPRITIARITAILTDPAVTDQEWRSAALASLGLIAADAGPAMPLLTVLIKNDAEPEQVRSTARSVAEQIQRAAKR